MSDALAKAAKMLAEPARAAMLLGMMGGRAVPAGELAILGHISPQTASEHLGRLVEARFVTVRQQGRHRYYELANEEIACVVESLLVLTSASGEQSLDKVAKPALGSMRHARTCYSHLAGWLGVAITDALKQLGHLAPANGRAFGVTESGSEWFEKRGITVLSSSDAPDPRIARQCIDWTERRPHLAGSLGVSMCKRFSELGWIEPIRKSRAVRVTLEGRMALLKELEIVVG